MRLPPDTVVYRKAGVFPLGVLSHTGSRYWLSTEMKNQLTIFRFFYRKNDALVLCLFWPAETIVHAGGVPVCDDPGCSEGAGGPPEPGDASMTNAVDYVMRLLIL